MEVINGRLIVGLRCVCCLVAPSYERKRGEAGRSSELGNRSGGRRSDTHRSGDRYRRTRRCRAMVTQRDWSREHQHRPTVLDGFSA